MIDHDPYGYRTVYCHFSEIAVRVGDSVRRGQRIGAVGTSGQRAWPGFEHLIAFDVLYVKGRDVSQRPLRDRRARLEDLLAGANVVYPARRLAADGLEAWAQVDERGYESLVAKDEASAYESGRTMRWLKVKQKGWTLEEDRWRRRITVATSHGPKK